MPCAHQPLQVPSVFHQNQTCRAGLGVDQTGLAFLLISSFPFIENLPGDAEVAAGVGYVLDLFVAIERPYLDYSYSHC
jgi:hypothetical protein